MINCNFVVDPTNANGLGVSSVNGAYIKHVYMHTSATPAAGNPNPAVGYILLQLTSKFNGLLNASNIFRSTTSGSNVNIDLSDAALTAGQLYVISALGTSLAADWLAVGVPLGVTPAVGVAFIAIATGAGTGTGTVQVPLATGSGINHIEMVGVPNLSAAPISGVNTAVGGSYIYLQCLAATNSSTTTLVKAAPAAGSVISLQILMSNSSLQINGM